MRKLIAFTALLLLEIPLAQATVASATLKVFWSETIPDWETPSEALRIRGISLDASGSIVALAEKGRTQPVLLHPSKKGPGPIIELAMTGHVWNIAQGPGGRLWLGGLTNKRMPIPGGTMADAYLVELDLQGAIVGEYSFFHSFEFRPVLSMTPLDSGELIIAGGYWLAAVSTQGELLWQRRFGHGHGIVLSSEGDRILAASIEKRREDGSKSYRDDVDVRTFNRAGRVVSRKTIRTNRDSSSGGYYGKLAMAKPRQGFYLLSSWEGPINAMPIEIIKLSVDGTIFWRKELSDSALQLPDGRSRSCDQGQLVLEDDDLLVLCSIEAQILVFRLDAETGDVTTASVPLPSCHEGRPAALFPTRKPNGVIWIIGSRPSNNSGKSCTWLGELSMP